jgi:hypothetical protein
MKLVPFAVGRLLIAIAASPLTLQAGDLSNPRDNMIKSTLAT